MTPPNPNRKQRVTCPTCGRKLWPSQLAEHPCRAARPQADLEDVHLSDAEIRRRLNLADWECQDCGRQDRPASIKLPRYCVCCARPRLVAGRAIK